MKIRITRTLVYEGEEKEVEYAVARGEEACMAISADIHKDLTIKTIGTTIVDKLQ